jgi:Ni,Fe-hydrogenase I cytochrome b subunit
MNYVPGVYIVNEIRVIMTIAVLFRFFVGFVSRHGRREMFLPGIGRQMAHGPDVRLLLKNPPFLLKMEARYS